MKKKRNTIWIAAMLTAAVLTGFSGCTEGEIPSLSSSDTAETATASPAESAAESSTEETAETSAAETEAATETAETIPAPDETTEPAAETTSAETTIVPEAGADTPEYAAAAKTLFGALNYIDQIGSGNLPKDETDTIQTTKSGVTYERVTKHRRPERLHDSFSDTEDDRQPLCCHSRHRQAAVHRCQRRTLRQTVCHQWRLHLDRSGTGDHFQCYRQFVYRFDAVRQFRCCGYADGTNCAGQRSVEDRFDAVTTWYYKGSIAELVAMLLFCICRQNVNSGTALLTWSQLQVL